MIEMTFGNLFAILLAGMGLGTMIGAAWRQYAIDNGWVVLP